MDKTDLTGFAAPLGESLTSRVGLLERLLRGAHYPSLGRYKENLLADTIRSFVPKSVEIGTGFILFPVEQSHPSIPSHLYDPLNQSGYIVSRQCDIIVYDTARYPTIFKDGDFVVVRPEAVRAVIEVKGSLNARALMDTLDSFLDFGQKWQRAHAFYRERVRVELPDPGLYVMAWDAKRTEAGRWSARPELLCSKIARFYAAKIPTPESRKDFPLLKNLLVHDEYIIGKILYVESEPDRMRTGWMISGGKFVRVSPDGDVYRDKDRTIATLLASLHLDVNKDDFNRFFSYVDEVKRHEAALPYEHGAFEAAWTDYEGSVTGTGEEETAG